MYIIINSTKKTTTTSKGGWRDLDEDLNNGDDIIVISLYSNSIKVPYKQVSRGIIEWEWNDYNLPVGTIIDNTLCVDCNVNYRSSGIDVCPSCESYRAMQGYYDDYYGDYDIKDED